MKAEIAIKSPAYGRGTTKTMATRRKKTIIAHLDIIGITVILIA